MLNGSLPKQRKHAVRAILFVALCNMAESWSWTSEWGKIIRFEVSPPDLRLTAQQQKDVAEYSELAEFVRRIQAGELQDKQERLQAWAAAVLAKQQKDGSFKRWEPLVTNGLQALRLSATYVDITPSGDGWTDPNTIDPSVPSGLCFGAVGFLLLMSALAEIARGDLKVNDLFAGVTDEVTGVDALKKALPTLAVKAEAAMKAQAEAAANVA